MSNHPSYSERVEKGRLSGILKFKSRIMCITCNNFIGNMTQFYHHRKVCKDAKGRAV